MASLQGTKVKDTYLGLLKTADAGAVTSTLKTIQDGGGNDSALKLSTTVVQAEGLNINSPASTPSSTTFLTWDSGTKSVGYKAIAATGSVTVTYDVTTATAPDLAITDDLGSTKTTQFRSGTNITLDGSTITDGATFTFSSNTKTLLTFDTAAGIASSNVGKVINLKLNNLSNGSTITLPPATAGAYLDFVIVASVNHEIYIDAASGDNIKGRVVLTSTALGKSVAQIASGSGTDRIVLDANGTATGGSFGDTFRLTAIDSETWLFDGILTTTDASPTTCTTLQGQP